MENWGLVIYREIFFLYNQNSSLTTEYNVVTTIAHEIAHMWLGNLITPKL
jgi:aminopeptidase N